MEQAELERVRQQFDQLVRERLAGAPGERGEGLQYGDDPGGEPGQLLARVVVAAPGEEPERQRAFKDFHDEHRAAFYDLRHELDKLPLRAVLQFRADGGQRPGEGDGPVLQMMMQARRSPGSPGPEGPGLTPVMV